MPTSVIIEDEPSARETLRNLLSQHCPQVTVKGEAHNVESGIDCINRCRPDIVFLDIEMPDGTGFDLITKLPSVDFNVIFTTAHSSYAIQAFRYSATHYLLKPIIPDELKEAVDKASEKLHAKEIAEQMRKLIYSLSDLNKPDNLVLSTISSITVVRQSEIIMCRSDRNYTTFFLEDGNEITVSKTLKEYETLLSAKNFFRPHRQYIVNVNHIKSFQRSNGKMIKLTRDLEAPVSMRKYDQLMELLMHL
ncbi:MAG: response regulator transcription factor [Clostridia bacterium]|nr:response regulator transcription factor [Clostridia bacterium]